MTEVLEKMHWADVFVNMTEAVLGGVICFTKTS